MAGMLGLDRDAQGNGLTPAEHQQIIRSQWAADGIMSGCEVIPSASDMSVTIMPGAVVLPMSGIGAAEGIVSQTRLQFDPAPSTGTDIYDILVRADNLPGSRPTIFMVKNGNPPPLSKRIEMWMIPAGVTNAQAGYSARLKDYAVPTGAGQQKRVSFTDTSVFGSDLIKEKTTVHKQDIYLPQDRMLDFRISQSFSAKQGGPEGSFQWIITDSVEGVITSPVLRYDAWPANSPAIGSTQYYSFSAPLRMGWHTLHWTRIQVTGQPALNVGGVAPAAQGSIRRPPNSVEVIDLGIVY